MSQEKVPDYKKNLKKIKPIVRSFRDKDDPYMRMTSHFELK